MNYTVNILVLIILIGLYNLKTEHIANNLLIVSSIFFTLLTIVFFSIKNNNQIKENMNNDRKVYNLSEGSFELIAHSASNNSNRRETNYYLHTTIPRHGQNSDCIKSGHKGCRDVSVVNLIKHDEDPHYWTFNKVGNKYEIKYGDMYLTRTPNMLTKKTSRNEGAVTGDCSNLYGNSTSCYDVILTTHSQYQKNPTHWILTKKPNTQNIYQIQSYFEKQYQNYYLYTTMSGEDGQDCEDAGLKEGGGKCRNVFLAPEHLDNSKISQNESPIYWKLILDPQSAPQQVNAKENEVQIKISESEMPGWQSTEMQLSGSLDKKFVNTNKDTNIKYFTGDPPPSTLWKCIQVGKGDDWLCVPRSSTYKLKHVTKRKLEEAEEDGYYCSTYDLNENFIGIKQLEEAEDHIISIPTGQQNFAVKKEAMAILSSVQEKNLDAHKVLDEDLNTYCSTKYEYNPKLHVWLNDDTIIYKIIIRQNPKVKDPRGELYPISVKIFDNNNVVFEEMFLKSNADDDGTYMIEDITIPGRLVLIEIPNKKAVLSLNNVYIIGKPAKQPKQDDNVQKTIKNEREICNIVKKQQKEKHNSLLQETIFDTETTTRKKTIKDLLTFINTPQSVIIWENINITGKSVKLELLRKEYLHISNIQVFGRNISNMNSNYKNWANDNKTEVILSSVYQDESNNYFGPEKCIDDNIDTYCRTNSTDKPFPNLVINFNEEIEINKIIVYNRKDKNRERLAPCKISIMNSNNNVINFAVKESFDKELTISKSFMESPVGCLSFDELNITDIGDVNRYRGWADVEGNGMKCNFCRIVGGHGQQYFSCASSTGDNQYMYNSLPNIDLGEKDSIFMSDIYGSNKDDFCRCVGNRYDKNVSCLVNNINEPNIGFNTVYPTSIPCNGKTGLEIQKSLENRNVSGKDLNNYNRIDSGFYYAPDKTYYLFKNTQIDQKDVVLFIKLNRKHKKVTNAALVTTGSYGTWPNLNHVFKKGIDCTISNGKNHVYFFKDNMVSKYDMKSKSVDKKYPIKIKEEFPFLPFDSIDEGYYAGDGIIVFFKNNKFVQYNINQTANKMRIIISNISQGGYGKMTFDKIDTAVSFYDNENDTQEILFTRNSECIIYNDSESEYDSEFNKQLHITEMFSKLWDINIDTLYDNITQNNNYQVESNNVPAENTATISTTTQQSTNTTTNSTNNKTNTIIVSPDTQVNAYASCNLGSSSVMSQAKLLGQKRESRRRRCQNIQKNKKWEEKAKIIVKDILEHQNISTHLKKENKDLNTLACELGVLPTDLLVAVSNGTILNPTKFVKLVFNKK